MKENQIEIGTYDVQSILADLIQYFVETPSAAVTAAVIFWFVSISCALSQMDIFARSAWQNNSNMLQSNCVLYVF